MTGAIELRPTLRFRLLVGLGGLGETGYSRTYRCRRPPRGTTTLEYTRAREEAREVGEQIGIDWASAPFDVEQLRQGMEVELEHGLHDPRTNVTDDDPVVTGKIAFAHLTEFPDYHVRLERMEQEAKREQEG